MNTHNIFEKNTRWHKRFLDMAKLISTWSKDPSTKCGAVIVDPQKRVISMGFNGFPAGTNDDSDLYQNREQKYKRIIHAEKNAILFAKQDLTGCSIYVWPMLPCTQCAAAIIQSGIKKVIIPEISERNKVDRWGEDFKETQKLLGEAVVGLLVIGIIKDSDPEEIVENKEVKHNIKECTTWLPPEPEPDPPGFLGFPKIPLP